LVDYQKSWLRPDVIAGTAGVTGNGRPLGEIGSPADDQRVYYLSGASGLTDLQRPDRNRTLSFLESDSDTTAESHIYG
jgi:hypothetical protein